MIKLLGIPFDDNSSYLKGHALAPPLIRLIHREGSSNAFSEHGIEILEGKTYEDLGDMVFSNTNSKDAYLAIRHRIQDELNDGSKILSFGGDHSISFPVIEEHASKYKDLHVLHLDAHADLYDNFDDNPYSHASPFARLMEKNMLASLTQVGIRTLNTHQSRFDRVASPFSVMNER